MQANPCPTHTVIGGHSYRHRATLTIPLGLRIYALCPLQATSKTPFFIPETAVSKNKQNPTDTSGRALVGSKEELISKPFDGNDDAAAPAGYIPHTDAGPAGEEVAPGPWDGLDELAHAGSHPLDELMAAIEAGQKRIELTGPVPPGLMGLVLAQIGRRTGKRLIALTPSLKESQSLAGDIALFCDPPETRNVLLLPHSELSPYSDVSPDRQLTQDRLAAIFSLQMELGGQYTVMPITALARKTVPAEVLLTLSDSIALDQQDVSNERLRKVLSDCGYTSVSLVEDRGTYAIRGDIVDIWSPFDDHPVRIERWGDEVTSIKTFAPETQRTRDPLQETWIFPVREVLYSEQTVRCARTRLRAAGETCRVPSKFMSRLMDDIQSGIHFLGVEALLPAFYDNLGPLSDLLPDDAIIVIQNPEGCQRQLEALWHQRHQEYNAAMADAQLAFPPKEHYLNPDDINAWINAQSLRLDLMGLVREALPQEDAPPAFSFTARSNSDVISARKKRQRAEGAVRALGEKLDAWRQLYGQILLVCPTAGETQRLLQLLDAYDQKAKARQAPIDPLVTVAPPCGNVGVVTGILSAGFRSAQLGMAVVTSREIFGHASSGKKASSRAFHEAAAISSFRDLEPGDMVVHTDFGIGRYAGLHKMEVGGIPGDFLIIEYSGRDKLYLPVYKLGRVQKFVGGDKRARVDKLGGTGWEKIKEKVKAQLKELAVDLIALYARRQTHPGMAFPGPDAYFREFEASFPFDETPDQLKAIDETLGDMQKSTVMDRLLCGDVGFGKTEVSMRAAFLAVLASKQVAVLVPTTVLCEQHLSTFRKRFEGYPVRIEALNRFRSRKDSRKILDDAEAGKVDILIGTHRLLSKDVAFRNLGLMIIDEEQRFGVGHKERLKEMRTQVDCLAMSATPIPRTLQMSLLGIRDMSIIATPPPGRLAVRTHIARFNETVVREAIMRELTRGGQVYFVHNRVQTIMEMAQTLQQIVPEARIAVGHGQMKESELEKVMLGFVKGDFNVLLSTTIIESGMDISNANTMIIDRADTFGLSQLYQLRGRIGRSSTRAYCYLLVHGRKLKPIAQERLEIIERFTALGSGFHVASYDLELRGAGNLLGPQQHGNIASVGLDLYGELLEEAIGELRGEEVEQEIEPEVNIPIPAYIPEGYIQEISLRLLFYKRLSLARTDEELSELYTELVDRFGSPPSEVEALRQVISIKIALRQLRCPRLDVGAGVVHLTLGDRPAISPQQAIALIQSSRGRYSLTPQMKLIRRLHPTEAQDRLKAALLVCQELKDFS